ncbi:glycoside hydrolase family 5 protein [Candidatus Saccharibacteria bacterium]|nr:glycoside hydrolase family 5 protein [Candidatus Saccharibacteria bacterium]
MNIGSKWRGVNLGGWLVLEKWMTPSLFAGLVARDEYSFCKELGRDASEILRIHRENFITEADFRWMAAHGLNAVRIPVGYWIFGHAKPYVGAIEYLDQAMQWAERYSLAVIIDLHGAPGSQNGRDHSGRRGHIDWDHAEHVAASLRTIRKLAERYAGKPPLKGIELLNEPSTGLRRRIVAKYYREAYDIIRRHCGQDVAVIIPEAVRPRRWRQYLHGDFQNVLIDTHQYQSTTWLDRRRNFTEHIRRVRKHRPRVLHRLQRSHPVIVGEWSAMLPPKAFAGFSDQQIQQAYQDYIALQLQVHATVRGWFYWSYKTERGGPWSFRDAYARGLLPANFQNQ